MRAPSLRSWACSSATICCGAPLAGGGTKNRVAGPMARVTVAPVRAAVLAVAVAAGSTEPAVTAAATATAAAAQLKRGRRMLTPGTVGRITGTFPERTYLLFGGRSMGQP